VKKIGFKNKTYLEVNQEELVCHEIFGEILKPVGSLLQHVGLGMLKIKFCNEAIPVLLLTLKLMVNTYWPAPTLISCFVAKISGVFRMHYRPVSFPFAPLLKPGLRTLGRGQLVS